MIISFDIETTGLNPLTDKIVSMQTNSKEFGTEYFDIYDKYWKRKVSRVLEDLAHPNVKIIMHNAIFEWQFIYAKYGVEITNFEDTMTLPFILDKTAPFEYLPPIDFRSKQENNRRKLRAVGLKRLAQYYLDKDIKEADFFEQLGTKKDPGLVRAIRALFTDTATSFHEIFKIKGTSKTKKKICTDGLYKMFKDYAKRDVEFTLGLWDIFSGWYHPRSYRIEIDIVPHLAKLQLRGIKVDTKKLAELSTKLESQIEMLIYKMKQLLQDETYDPNKKRMYAAALKQRGHILPKTLKGNDTTGKAALVNIEDELKDLMNEYNRTVARKRQHVDGIKREMDEHGVYHPHYISCGTVHGRFSSKTEGIV